MVFACLTGFSQPNRQQTEKRVQVLNADKVTFDEKITEAKILEGNVRIRHEGTLMYCELAHVYEKENRFEAFRSVHINQGDTVNLYGDSLKYFGETKFAEMRGRVRMVDRKMTLNSKMIYYDLEKDEAWYDNGGTLFNKADSTTLTSQKGIYDSRERSMIFSGNVDVKGKGYTMAADSLEYSIAKERTVFRSFTTIQTDSAKITCSGGWYNTDDQTAFFTGRPVFTGQGREAEADTIYYQQNKGFGELIGNAVVVDTANRTSIKGNYGVFREKEDYAMITGRALFEQHFDSDTLYLHADTLVSVKDSLDARLLLAYYGVRIFKHDLQGVCDSMSYGETDSLLQMFGNPILWHEDNQLSAEFIRVKTSEGKPQVLEMFKSSWIISQADTVGFNQIKGRDITGWFKEGQLNKVVVVGNGQTIYYAGDEGKPYVGLNNAECSDILIYLDSSKIQTISFINSPEASLTPMKMVSESNKLLKDFKWLIALRPLEPEDVFETASE